MPVYKRDVTSLSKSGSAKLKGDVTVSEGDNITITQSGQDIEIAASASGSGDVTGPASSTDNAIARFHETTGKIIQNSSWVLEDSGNLYNLSGTFSAGKVSAVLDGVFTDDISEQTAGAGVTVDGVLLKDGGVNGVPIVTTTATQTLTNKTLTSPKINEDVAVTATATELNYTDGVTSAIQTQLDGKQPLDSDLTTIAGLTATTDNFMVAASSAWASRTPAQAKTALALVKGDVGLGNVDNTSDATKKADIIGTIYPVGSIYISVNSTNPATVLGLGTWATFGAGKVLVGLDSGDTDFDTAEETGGAKTHTLTTAEMPAHQHNIPWRASASGLGNEARAGRTVASGGTTGADTALSGAAVGGGGAHNNVQPYIVVYMFKRTA